MADPSSRWTHVFVAVRPTLHIGRDWGVGLSWEGVGGASGGDSNLMPATLPYPQFTGTSAGIEMV